LNTLQALQRDITLAKNRAMEGRTVEVLVEGASRKGGQLSGRSANNKVVNFFGDPEWAHTIVPVRIQQGCMNSLKGIVPD
jgi:tRNA-2-methylthio-N6-dimethylallyladenosine synthase